MNEIIKEIDNEIKACVNGVNAKGLCHILKADNQSFPTTVETNERVSPDGRNRILTYHRLLASNGSPREDVSFGKKTKLEHAQSIRMVVFIAKSQPDTIIDDIANAIPDELTVSGYQLLQIDRNINTITDAHAVWDTEFNDAYRDKYQLTFRVYAIDYTLKYIKCNNC